MSDAYYKKKRVACNLYRNKINSIAINDSSPYSFLNAREVLHKKHKLPRHRNDEEKNELGHMFCAGDYILEFIMQFKDWETHFKQYDERYANLVNHISTNDLNQIIDPMTVEMLEDEKLVINNMMEFLGPGVFSDLCGSLEFLNDSDFAKKLLKFLSDDPMFGPDARRTLDSMEFSEKLDKMEESRREQLHPQIKKLHKIADQYWWICSLHYPWVHPAHNVPNCLTIMADGSPCVRFEVLDPHKVTKFRFAENVQSGTQWIPVQGLKVDQVIDFNQLKKILEMGRDQAAATLHS